MQNKWVAIFVVIIAVLAGGTYAFKSNMFGQVPGAPQNSGDTGVVCTMEAKLCPDGSYVGRTGPKCEFSACPTSSTTTSGNATLEGGLNQTLSGGGISIVPLEVVEDSRCPSGVECIQAGTVRLKAQVVSAMGTGDITLTLNKPSTTEAQTITLIQVAPLKKASSTISSSDYRFTIVVSPR